MKKIKKKLELKNFYVSSLKLLNFAGNRPGKTVHTLDYVQIADQNDFQKKFCSPIVG